MHHERSLSPIPRSQDWACGPSAYACFSFSLLTIALLVVVLLFTLALLVFVYSCLACCCGVVYSCLACFCLLLPCLLLWCYVYCVDGRWSTWLVRVGAPRKIFKPHSQVSRLGMWAICFPIWLLYTEGLFVGLFF